MPALASLLNRSASGVLRSTFPPYTPPAWTTALTGVNPGRHGIFGFVRGRGSAPELVHWGAVRTPALWDFLGDASIGLFHVPLTFPPPRVPGWCVGAVWMPTGRPIDGYTSPPGLQARIESLAPGYAPVVGVDVREDWRGTDLALHAAAVLRDRKRVLADLLEHSPTDVVFAVLETPDRLQHAYYRYLDPADPMSNLRSGTLVREAAASAFAELDSVIGMLDQYAGPNGVAIVCSDHGATGWDGYLHGNALLEQTGLLAMHARGRAAASIGGGRLESAAIRMLPRRTMVRMRRRSASLVDWPATEAYAARLGTQGFSVNMAGREEHGSVPSDRTADVLERLRAAIEGVRTPAGRPFAAAVRTREETYAGRMAAEAPDLLVEPDGWHWEISDRFGAGGLFDDFSGLPLGCHHPDGVFALRARGVRTRSGVVADIADVTPTLLYAAGAAVPDGLDGRARTELFGQQARPVVQAPLPLEEPAPVEESPYTEEEEAQIVKYLTDLGYLG
jgi:predicted AlkP superfamily phosphohydrolase/phosphomutase